MVLPFKMRLEAGEVADGLATITPGIVVGCKQKFKRGFYSLKTNIPTFDFTPEITSLTESFLSQTQKTLW